MLETKAVFKRKDTEVETTDCVVEKVVRLSGAEFDRFSKNLMQDWDFIRDNNFDTSFDKEGRRRCLLVVGEGKNEGVLVGSEGSSYARYSAYFPGAEDFLSAGRYPALTELNRKLTGIVDIIAEHAGEGSTDGRGVVDLQRWDEVLGIDLMTNAALRNTVLAMLDERPEIRDWSLDKNELTVYRTAEPESVAEDLSDPTVTRTDMYAYGYSWDGMIPLGKERALELYDKGREVFRLYENDAEGAAGERADIETFDGLFGVEDPEWKNPEHPQPLQAFILNRERHDKGEAAGEWLTLPSDSETLRGLLNRIGVERPSEGAFTVTALRVPYEYMRDYVSKYDSLDELNMLASYMKTAEDYYELDTYNAVLSSGIVKVGNGTAALINLLDTNNIECFELIDAKDPESLARYYHRENNEKPDGVSFEKYGIECVREEHGVFTEWGYVKRKYDEFAQRYTGAVPDEYEIIGEALRRLRESDQEHGSGDKPSVMDQIRAARQTSSEPKNDTNKQIKHKGGPEL